MAQKQPFVVYRTLKRVASTLHGAALQGKTVTLIVAGSGADAPEFLRLLSLSFQTYVVDKDGRKEKISKGPSSELFSGWRVLYLGTLQPPAMKEVLKLSDITFLPSEMEGIALVLYEAMAAETAVIGAKVGGQGELITKDCECGILLERKSTEHKEVEVYSSALLSLLEDPNRLQLMKRTARKRIEGFSLETMVGCVLESFGRARKHANQEEQTVNVIRSRVDYFGNRYEPKDALQLIQAPIGDVMP